MLREYGMKSGQLIKILFTTTGGCGVLAKTISFSERIDAGRMVQAKPGHSLKGWSSFGDLRLL
jgi:hypothetical protein